MVQGSNEMKNPYQVPHNILRWTMPRRRGGDLKLFPTVLRRARPRRREDLKWTPRSQLLGLPFCFSSLNIFIKIPKDLIANYQDSAVPCLKLRDPLGRAERPLWSGLPHDCKTWWICLRSTLLTVFPNGSPGSATILLAVIYFLIFCTDKSSVLAKHLYKLDCRQRSWTFSHAQHISTEQCQRCMVMSLSQIEVKFSVKPPLTWVIQGEVLMDLQTHLYSFCYL